MPIIMHQLDSELRFTISGPVCQRISVWECMLDEMVFNEQLTTGSFRGRYPVDDEMKSMMQAIRAKGHIAPYYGAGGSRGSCVYALQMTDRGYVVRVENITVKESAEFTDETDGDLSPHPILTFKIDGKELQNIRQWEHWVEQQAPTSRYIYKFGQVALGRLGYTVEVVDIQTGNMINATDYSDW
jgi:hypothetical protein